VIVTLHRVVLYKLSLCALSLCALPGVAHARSSSRRVLLDAQIPAQAEAALRRELARRNVTVVAAPNLPRVPDHRPQLVAQIAVELAAARQLYYQAQPERAAERLEAVLKAQAPSLAREGQFRALHQIYLWFGISLAKAGDNARAILCFIDALILDRSPLDATRFPPSVLGLFSRAARTLAQRQRQPVRLRVEPSGADINVDGRRQHRRTMRLTPGTHWLQVRAIGYRPVVRRLQVAGSDTLSITLRRAPPQWTLSQLARLKQRGELDTHREQAAAVLGRMRRAGEALVATTRPEATRLQLSLSRVRCDDAYVLARVNLMTDPRRQGRAIQDAMARLWPISTPLYRKWWFWAAVGTVVAGSVTAIAIGAQADTRYTVVP